MGRSPDEPLNDGGRRRGGSALSGDSETFGLRGPHPLSPIPSPSGEPLPVAPPGLPMDWENFYKNYRKPDYISGYEIVNKLGGGVFGAVYKARKESIGKFYAIKFLKIDDEDVKEAVLRELEAVKFFAQIDHPNLVSIEDKGEVDGIPFIVMGYAGEETLKRRLERGRLDDKTALAIFVQILHGVQALHERSIIHFDLKPANVFLKGDFARVGDYGLSRLMSESRNTLSFGRGTPYYMAPEMLRKKGDRRSDVYSLGVIFYECLTGEVPFQGETEWEVLKKHETEPVRFPDYVAAAHRRVIEKMLAKEPERRYDSVREVLAALGETGTNPVPPPIPRPAARPETPAAAPHPRPHDGAFDAGPAAARTGESPASGTVHAFRKGPFFAEVRTGPRPLAGLVTALRALRRRLTLAMSEPAGYGEATASSRLPVPSIEDADLPTSAPGAFLSCVGLLAETAVLAALLPARYVIAGLRTVLEFALKLPFRLLGIAWRLAVVAMVVVASVFAFTIIFRVFGSILQAVFRF